MEEIKGIMGNIVYNSMPIDFNIKMKREQKYLGK